MTRTEAMEELIKAARELVYWHDAVEDWKGIGKRGNHPPYAQAVKARNHARRAVLRWSVYLAPMSQL